MENFRNLGICEQMLKVIEDEKFIEPSEIQVKAIPIVLSGKDIIAGAQTGSGKTLAFGSSIIQNSKKDYGLQSLVLTPTRELAVQIVKELRKFGKNTSLKIIPVYGGVSFNEQVEKLESAEVVVGTPGRILDHISKRTIDLHLVKILVLDEADRMLDMGFKEDVDKIIDSCPKKRQTLLFSATITPDIAIIAKRHLNNPIEVSAEQYVDSEKLNQVYYDIDDDMKYSLLVHLLKNEKSGLVMVFCNTRNNVDFVANNLISIGIDAVPIHGGFSQDKRLRVLENFHTKKSKILVCTDIAARGLDIKGVSHIYNYDLPKESKEYIHRIGRTARAGEEGKVINLVASRDYQNFQNVLTDDFIKISLEKTPSINHISFKWMQKRRFGRRNNNMGKIGNRRSFDNRPRDYENKNDNQDRIGSRRNFDNRPRSHDNRNNPYNRNMENRNSSPRKSPRNDRFLRNRRKVRGF
ncbi:MAG: DEAD/DEAH box helicase [Nanoarchaeota archaeon]|nr:DEAD/DEAH box helicase [Nanoarchaeota archaeon]